MMTTSNTKVTVRFRSSVVMLSDVAGAASCCYQWRERGAEGGPGGGRLGERGQRQTRTGLVIRVQMRLGDTTVLMDRRSGSMGLRGRRWRAGRDRSNGAGVAAS